MKFAFVDTEFTGEHGGATLVSLALVGMADEELYVTLDDYDRAQVTPWLEENVLRHIDASQSVSSAEAYALVSDWLGRYSGGERVALVSAGKLFDLILLFDLWRFQPDLQQPLHYLHSLPGYLRHSSHIDLETMFLLAGIDPSCDRSVLVGGKVRGPRHHALHDARVVRECFKYCLALGAFPKLGDWPAQP